MDINVLAFKYKGVWITEDNKVYMNRCPQCGLENYAMAVTSGQCVWCGFKPSYEDVKLVKDKIEAYYESLNKGEKDGNK